MITIQDGAYKRLNELRKKHNKKFVRLDVKGGGCAGFNYEWSFDDGTDKAVISNTEELVLTNLTMVDTGNYSLKIEFSTSEVYDY